MTDGAGAVVQTFDVPDNFVPRNNTELVQVYGPYVSKLVMRQNRILSNYKDLVQHIWLKLLEADVLEKYNRSLGHPPKVLTAEQVCSYLCLPSFAFRTRVQEGLEVEQRFVAIFERDRGQCHRCNMPADDMSVALRVLKAALPEYYAERKQDLCGQLGLEDIPECLWAVEECGGRELTVCLFCSRQHSIPVVSYKWYPTAKEGHWTSKQALYAREDVDRLRLALESESDRQVDIGADPSSVLSKSNFKQYLARAVHNFYANWCRTRARRYQEAYKGYDETTGRHWEDTLGDPFGASQEILCDLKTTVQYLAGGGDPDESSGEAEAEVIGMIEAGKSAQEVAKRQGVRPKAFQSLVG